MRPATRAISNFLGHPAIIVAGTWSSIICLIWLFYDKITANTSSLSLIIFIIVFTFLIVAHLYSFYLRQHISALQNISEHIHKINHDYRDVLNKTFKIGPTLSQEQLISKEIETLEAICQSIENIFRLLIRKDCIVTIKLITQENGTRHCTTYTRSEKNCKRDKEPPPKYVIGTGQNTAFDVALTYNLGRISHFWSPNLFKETAYSNERPQFTRYYRSAIVVPIRCLNTETFGTPESNDIGFLCVDTKSRNRLNNGYHIELLAGLADQMYNFMNLMRGNYNLYNNGGQ